MKLMFWLQHHWCLYICWLVQLPAMCCFVPLALLAWAFGHDSPRYGAEDQLVISLCFIMILVYIYQIFFYFLHRLTATRMLCVQIYQSIFVAIFIFYFRAVLFPFHSPPDDWLPVARAIWIGLPVTFASFYILLVRSVIVWHRLRQNKRISLIGKDGEEFENLLQDENYV